VRLGTASFRFPVHHLCNRLGFTRVAECTPFMAPILTDQPALPKNNSGSETTPEQAASSLFTITDHTAPVANFCLVLPDQATVATTFALQSPALSLTHGLMELDWRWAPPQEAYITQIIGNQKAWWWREGKGLLALREDQDPGKAPTPLIQLLACSMEDIVECLLDYRCLAAALGYQRAGWFAPLHPDLLPALSHAGFQRDWDASMYIYSRP